MTEGAVKWLSFLYAGIDSLNRLEDIERLQSLEGDYKDVKIPAGSIIYCDPPYRNTNKYNQHIDYPEFISWCNQQSAPVYVSSYHIDGLHLIAEHEHRSIYGATANNKVMERIYGNDLAYEISKENLQLLSDNT